MTQLGLGLDLSTKRTRKREFLDEMTRVVPWQKLIALIEPHYPKGKTGRPPFPIQTMLRIHFLQQWFSLSDPAMEEALHDIPLYREFALLGTGMTRLPDESTILRFRHLLEAHELSTGILATVNEILQAKGLMLKVGSAVDATLISAPNSTKKPGTRDPEMRQTQKGGSWYFGMKAHIGVDVESGLVHTVKCTPANVHDITVAHELLHGKEKVAFGVDPTYWANILHDGISPLIETPRDVVRAVNALLVTFPGLRGEVNPVDFIALECLRVFVPDAYQFVRDNKDRFTGLASERGGDRTSAHDFYERWLNTVDERYRDTIKALFRRLFPRMQAVWGNMYYSADSMRRWGVEARICHPDKFDRYFQFSVPPHELSERDIREFITLGANVHALADAWIAANDERRPTGTGKANELIAALIARDDLPVAFAKACLKAFFRIGDGFVGDARNSSLHFFSIRPEVQAYWLVQHLTKMLPEGEGELLIEEQIRTGDAIVLAAQMAWSIARMHQPDAQERDSVFQAFAPETVEILKLTVVARVRHAAKTNALEWLPDIHFLLRLWQTWGSDVEVKAWFARILNDDRAILRLLVEAVQVGTEHTHGDRTTRRIPSMNTKIFEGYLSPPVTLEEFSARIRQIGDRRALTADEIEALEVFENGMQMVRDGRNPSDPFARLGL